MYQVRWDRVLIVALVLMSPWILSGMSHLLSELALVRGLNEFIADSFYHPKAFKGLLLWAFFVFTVLLLLKVAREQP